MRVSSGVTAKATTSDTAVTVISAVTISDTCATGIHARVTNEGGVAGFVSFDGGTVKHRLPADQLVTTFYNCGPIISVLAYRIASGTDITGIFAEVWG